MILRHHTRTAALLATEWVFMAALLVIGSIAGLIAVKDALNRQIGSVSEAILAVDPVLAVQPVIERPRSVKDYLQIDVNLNDRINWLEVDLMPCD